MSEGKTSILNEILKFFGISNNIVFGNKNTYSDNNMQPLLEKLTNLENLKNILEFYSDNIDDYGMVTTYVFDTDKVDLDDILSKVPISPCGIDTYWSSNKYVKFRNKDLLKYHYEMKETVNFNKLINELYDIYSELSELEKKEFEDSFLATLEKLFKFMESMTLETFKGENYQLAMDILESILEFIKKEKSVKMNDLRKDLEIEAEYLKKIKENPLYF